MACQIEELVKEELFEQEDEYPLFGLLLLNDDLNYMDYIVDVLVDVLRLSHSEAFGKMITAHNQGKVLVKTGPKEHLQFYQDQLGARNVSSKIIGWKE